jgi:geranylgeranyl reductase family protein
MTSCDALIVGGGPAGSTCAWKLRRQGLDVLVLDKHTFPRDKPCAGWITPQVVDELKLDLADYQQSRTLQPITGFATALMTGPDVVTSYDRPISYGIRRREFDHYLLVRSGARVRLGEPLRSMERQADGWRVNGDIRTPLVIGAGGHFCPVARHLGAKPGRTETAVTAQEIEFEMTPAQIQECAVSPGVPYLYFCDDLTGYGWYYRKGNFLNVGLGREDPDELSKHVAVFCDLLKQRRKIPQDLPGKMVGHAYLLYHHAPRTVVSDGVLLIGDAAGLAYDLSGEGIRPAVESGLMAAEVVRAAAGNYPLANLQPYATQLQARFGKKERRSSLDFVPLGLYRLVAAQLMKSRWFSRHVIVERWFLNAHKAALSAG